MNVHAQPPKTPAEEALLASFRERFSRLPGDSETASARDEAIEQLKSTGLPNRRIESWHYTDLRRLLSDIPVYDPTATAETLETLIAGSSRFTVANGRTADAAEIEGLSVSSLGERLAAGDSSTMESTLARDNAIGMINRAFVSDGWVLSLSKNLVLENPVELQVLHGGGQAHVINSFAAGEGSKAVVVERLSGNGEALSTSVSQVQLERDAELTWIILQEQPEIATGLARFDARLAENSKLNLFLMNAGGKLVRHEIAVQAEGEGAEFQLRGINLLSGDGHTDITMTLDHLGYATTSEEIIRNIVTGKARGVFQGQIRVDRAAQKTDARMACNTLLLSDNGEFSAKPELEIFADDVACGHGATVTEIDADHLFYMMSRGIDERQARGLLVKAFVAEIIEELEDENLIEALELKLDSWFAEHG